MHSEAMHSLRRKVRILNFSLQVIFYGVIDLKNQTELFFEEISETEAVHNEIFEPCSQCSQCFSGSSFKFIFSTSIEQSRWFSF